MNIPKVNRVYWPGFDDFSNNETAKNQMKDFGGVVTFDLKKNDKQAVQDFVSSASIFTLAESLGGVESLISHPATMSHASLSKEERESSGIVDSLMRLSIGIEDADDLVEDLRDGSGCIMIFKKSELKDFLDQKADQFNTPEFIPKDPVSIPHLFTKRQDIEIMGFFAAILAWGQRKTIISKCHVLIELMEGAPHDFIVNHRNKDLKRFLDFKHRTFNPTDLLYFISFFREHYSKHDSLESAFDCKPGGGVQIALENFHTTFFSMQDVPERTKKHIASPAKKSTCKRLNMYLRWMVRNDKKGVDFGLWKSISPSQLFCPLDLHVDRVARKLGLINSKATNWKTVLELTENLRKLDPKKDLVKYDFALFGLGGLKKF